MKKLSLILSIASLIVACSALAYRVGYYNAIYDIKKNQFEVVKQLQLEYIANQD